MQICPKYLLDLSFDVIIQDVDNNGDDFDQNISRTKNLLKTTKFQKVLSDEVK